MVHDTVNNLADVEYPLTAVSEECKIMSRAIMPDESGAMVMANVFACPVSGTDGSVGIDFDRVPENVKRYLLEYAANVAIARMFARGKDEPKVGVSDRLDMARKRVEAWYAGKPTLDGGRPSDPITAEVWRFAYAAGKSASVDRAKGEDLPAYVERIVRAKIGDKKVSEKKVGEFVAATMDKWRAAAEKIVADRKDDSGIVLDI
jgi:hypothetical protein